MVADDSRSRCALAGQRSAVGTEVDPAGVDVESLAEVLEARGRALDVPPRKPVARPTALHRICG